MGEREHILEGSFGDALRAAGDFFMKADPIHETIKRLAMNLQSAGIEYAVIGGMALAGHGLVRVTEDVDILPAGPGTGPPAKSC